MFLRLISIKVFAQHSGMVTGSRKRAHKCRILEAALKKFKVPAVRSAIEIDAGIVWKVAGEDRGPRRAAKRVRDEIIGECDAVLLHLENMRHTLHQVE